MDYTLEPNVTITDYYPDLFTTPCDPELILGRGTLTLAVLYCVLFVLGLLGNSLVVLVLVACKKLRSITDVYLLNLAVSDLLFVFSFPFQTHHLLDQWVFGTAACKVVSGLYYVGFFSSMFFVTLMSVDRYLAIVHAVHAMRVRTARVGAALSLAAWLVAVAAAAPLLVFYRVSPEDGLLQCFLFFREESLRWKLFAHLEVNVLGLLLPFAVLLFCYARILRQLRGCVTRNRTRAIKLVLAVVAAALLFWVPFNVALFLQSLHDMRVLGGCAVRQRLALATHVTEVISLAHCCVNPVIYAFVGERFKKHLADVFQKSCSHALLQLGLRVPAGPWEGPPSSQQRSSPSSTQNCIL
ncbi:C-C chemokine receptor type 8 [Psammomys obesus]|uniref:C-C chemokine receptor type 8 n=1 Tax=Psammomys obesus TaxID=48139 RepID=UPI0024536F72|nr:C-C chemokine receptor type 8 [Psammomys obesus]